MPQVANDVLFHNPVLKAMLDAAHAGFGVLLSSTGSDMRPLADMSANFEMDTVLTENPQKKASNWCFRICTELDAESQLSLARIIARGERPNLPYGFAGDIQSHWEDIARYAGYETQVLAFPDGECPVDAILDAATGETLKIGILFSHEDLPVGGKVDVFIYCRDEDGEWGPELHELPLSAELTEEALLSPDIARRLEDMLAGSLGPAPGPGPSSREGGAHARP